MRVSTATSDQVAYVTVVGEPDISNVDTLRAAMATATREPARAVIADFTAVTFMDSTTLSVLVDTFRELQAQDRGFAVAAAEHDVRRLLAVSGLDGVFTVRDTLQDAEHAVR